MSDIAIRVDKLGKQYHIGGVQKQFDTLGAQLTDAIKSPFRRAGKLLRGQAKSAAELDERFWALKDVSFEVRQGEVIGIIGRNGAGKSTLLKILSRITDPTNGEATIYGRVGSLLEVGTGFHPELTGRENIFLNGAILGMKKIEIERKFDEIVSFAEIEKFIDTPVKHYSSGMYVRLAFSVAAHLDPEVLLVDEVLAVGDLAFQRKCLGKMDDVANQGRTVLFVSHNMGLMQSLCERGIFLRAGSVCVDGPMTEAVDSYLQTLESARSEVLSKRKDRKGFGKARLVDVEITDQHGNEGASAILKTGAPVRFTFHVDKLLPGMACDVFLFDHIGQPVSSFRSEVVGPRDSKHSSQQKLQFVCDIDQLLLLPGRYRMNVVVVGDNQMQDFVEAVTVFDVGPGHLEGRPVQAEQRFSTCMPHRWTTPAT